MLQSDHFSMGLASNLDRQNKTVLAIVIGILVSKIINLFFVSGTYGIHIHQPLCHWEYIDLRDTRQLAVIAWVARSHTLVVSVGITLSLHCFCLHWIALIIIGGFVFVCLFVCCFPVLFSKIEV